MKKNRMCARMGLMGLVLAWVTGAATLTSDRLFDMQYGLWLGECMANWTGLQTECGRTQPTFFGMDDTNSAQLVFNSIWGADDDTDVEYVYLYLMGLYGPKLTAHQLMDGYVKHITRLIWNATYDVRSFAGQGIPLPFAANFNSKPLWISDQLKTEIFGAVSPGMVTRALDIAALTITTRSFAAHASQFYEAMFAAAATIDTTLPYAKQMEELVHIGRGIVPNTSKAADCIDFVLNDYLDNPDKSNWEATRDKIYIRYRRDAALNGFQYLDCAESSINLAAGVLCALYGQGDFKKTVQIGALAGWDSDNQPATLGALVGYMYGYKKLHAYLAQMYPGRPIGELYNARRTRDSLPDYIPGNPDADDSLVLMAHRSVEVAEWNIVEAGGSIDSTTVPGKKIYTIPQDSAVNHLYVQYQKSLNNQVRAGGGKIVAKGIGNDSIPLICDGCENEWSGTTSEAQRCYKGSSTYYTSPAQTGKTEEWYSVTYDRPALIEGVMLYTASLSNAGGFSSLNLDIQVNGAWTPAGSVVLPEFSSDTPWQVLTISCTPVLGTGVRVKGSVSGKNTSTSLTEIDAIGTIDGAVGAYTLTPESRMRHQRNLVKTISLGTGVVPVLNGTISNRTVLDIRGRILQPKEVKSKGSSAGVYFIIH